MYKAIGCHVFAGAMSAGVQQAGFEMPLQVETHGFGLDSARQFVPEVVNLPYDEWPVCESKGKYAFCCGNPRCTGFSSVTCGLDETAHGPWAKQTQDIHELCDFGIGIECPVICWESVQQAYTVGRPLLDYLRDTKFAPNGYRIVHMMLDASSFGNAQKRRRYFFLAYKGDRPFNVSPPVLPNRKPCTFDALWNTRDNETHEAQLHKKDCEYDRDSYARIRPELVSAIRALWTGWSLHDLGRYTPHVLSESMRRKWDDRTSGIPFSLHAHKRLGWLTVPATLTSSCRNQVHPDHDRGITVGEAASIMGWPAGTIPKGPSPYGQIAKGVVPSVARWLGEQVIAYLNNEWDASDDFESSYDDNDDVWTGGDAHGKIEKVFDLTRYCSKIVPTPENVGIGAERQSLLFKRRYNHELVKVSKNAHLRLGR